MISLEHAELSKNSNDGNALHFLGLMLACQIQEVQMRLAVCEELLATK
jgi:hypothetical protein